MNVIVRQLFLSVAAIMVLGLSVQAQQSKPCNITMVYDNHNQVDPSRFSVTRVSGLVISEVGRDQAKEIGPLPGACVGLFTEQDHRLVATTVTDQEGRFQFSTISSGEYRLVVQAKPLCLANLPLRVLRHSHSAASKQRHLIIHMRPAGIDDCSYGEYK